MADERIEQMRQSLRESKGILAVIFIRALADPDSDVREQAVEALVRLGVIAVPQLLEALNSESAETRESAAEALGKIGDLEGATGAAVVALMERMNDENRFVRAAVIVALAKIASSRTTTPPELLHSMHRATEDPEPLVRKQAIWAISHIIAAASRMLDDA